jgi:hypothetical protein
VRWCCTVVECCIGACNGVWRIAMRLLGQVLHRCTIFREVISPPSSLAIIEEIIHLKTQAGDDGAHVAPGKAVQEYATILPFGDGEGGFPIIVGRTMCLEVAIVSPCVPDLLQDTVDGPHSPNLLSDALYGIRINGSQHHAAWGHQW